MTAALQSKALQSFLRSRRSVRAFKTDPVSPEIVERILETASWAPSSHNRQPWRFIVLQTQESKIRLAEGMGEEFRQDLSANGLDPETVERTVSRSRDRIVNAPLAVLLCLDPNTGDLYPDARRQQAEYLMGVQSTALAGGQLLLAAHAEGLGGVWVCAPLFAPDAVRASLNFPPEWQPQALLLFGFPARIPPARERFPISEVASFV
jgi:coenzyme F420-0:L-glutamate ligase / coenzyme F420-1:gamma-L-glutamate ligase